MSVSLQTNLVSFGVASGMPPKCVKDISLEEKGRGLKRGDKQDGTETER